MKKERAALRKQMRMQFYLPAWVLNPLNEVDSEDFESHQAVRIALEKAKIAQELREAV